MFSYLLSRLGFNILVRSNRSILNTRSTLICWLLSLWLARREVEAVDGSLRASLLALATHLALLSIDVGKVVLERDGLELLASLDALAATDTGSLANLVGDSSLVLVVAEHNDSATFRAFETNLDDASRTSLCTGSASGTLLFVNLWQTRLWVHVEGIELTLGYTIAAAEATIAAACLAHACHLLDATTLSAVELCLTGTVLASAVTADDCYFRSTCLYCKAEDACHLFHDRLAAHRTKLALQASLVSCFHASSSKARASWVAAAAAVCLWQHFTHLGNARVFMHSKFV